MKVGRRDGGVTYIKFCAEIHLMQLIGKLAAPHGRSR